MNEQPRQEVMTRAEQAPTWDARPAPAMTPMELLNQAVSKGASIELLERLMALQERYAAQQARRAFDEAMAAAKAKIPTIAKNRKVSFGSSKGDSSKTEYRHEDLAEIARTVDPILSEHGLSYRWRTASPIDQPVSVTCIVSHRDGHSEENTLMAGRDTSGSKNPIQSLGSALSYLQRYTLKAALGLAAANDDDGKNAGAADNDPISSEQFGALHALMKEVGATEEKFCAYFKVGALVDLPAAEFKRALAALEAKRGK